jgi:hypothetical protein
LEFYFQRSYPETSKDYLASALQLANAFSGKKPTEEIKYTGRQVKDIIPQFEFNDVTNTRFPYRNISFFDIPGYVETQDKLGTSKYISGPVMASSKGWTMYTSDHSEDPAGSLVSTDPFTPNVFNGDRPREELQGQLYNQASSLLGDKITVYESFWHPLEAEYFSDVGVNVDKFTWALELRSTVAPIDRIFRHEDYGCHPAATNELYDGRPHFIENWQPRGVFHYQCDPRYSYGCLSVVMNKCNEFLFHEYGTDAYLNNDVISRFTYTFQFPPQDAVSYMSASLINFGEIGGTWGGNFVSAAAAASAEPPYSYSFGVGVPPAGGGKYQ